MTPSVNFTDEQQPKNNNGRSGSQWQREGRRQVPLRFWQSWPMCNMNTATFHPPSAFPNNPLLKFTTCQRHESWCDGRGPSGSIMVKISLDQVNYLFCASTDATEEVVVEKLGIPPNLARLERPETECVHLQPPLRGVGTSAVAAAIVGTQKR